MDLRRLRTQPPGSAVNVTIPSPEIAPPPVGQDEQFATVVEQIASPPEESLLEGTATSPEVSVVLPTPTRSETTVQDSETPPLAAETSELTSEADPSQESQIESSSDPKETAANADTAIGSAETDVDDEAPSPPIPAIRENDAPTSQIAEESPTPAIPTSLKEHFYQPDRESNTHSTRGKGAIEIIEELCIKSLDGINSLIRRSNDLDTEQNRQLESKLSALGKQNQELASERDELASNCHDWKTACDSLQDQLKASAPYQTIFSQSLPPWLSMEKLRSLLNLAQEDDGEFAIDPKVVWKILPGYINLIDELKAETLAPRQLTSATDTFSEAVCAFFEGNDQQVSNWHESANEHLKPNGYSFMILAVGTQIDNDLMTGAIQGKTMIGTIKRMPLIKDGGDVIRKADVSGV